jgi:hypothetical protein
MTPNRRNSLRRDTSSVSGNRSLKKRMADELEGGQGQALYAVVQPEQQIPFGNDKANN